MKIKFIKPSYEVDMLGQTGIEKLKRIEQVARLCYKSEDKITEDSYIKMVNGLVKRNHLAMLEHASLSVKFITERAFTHELVRHRIASFAQESQRYVGYGETIQFIIPAWMDVEPFEAISMGSGFSVPESCGILSENKAYSTWTRSMIRSAQDYNEQLSNGLKPEDARGVLPNDTKTEIIITTNLREWMHVQELRDAPTASPQMRKMMEPLFIQLGGMIPGVFR